MARRNPPAVPRDTSPEVWRRQMEAITSRSVADRLEEWAALNRLGAQMEADGIRRRHPEYTDRQVFLALVRIRYGDDLASKAWPRGSWNGTLIDLTAALESVLEALDELEIDYIIVGSTAAAAWGVVRMTRDVDLVAVIQPEAASRFVKRLTRPDVYFPQDEAAEASRNGGSFNLLHPSSGGKVDIFVVRSDDAFTQSRMARRVHSEVLGMPAWIATPEDVVLAKLRWRLESLSETQWRDCVEIAAVQSLDEAYLRSWATSLGVVDDLNDLLDETSTKGVSG